MCFYFVIEVVFLKTFLWKRSFYINHDWFMTVTKHKTSKDVNTFYSHCIYEFSLIVNVLSLSKIYFFIVVFIFFPSFSCNHASKRTNLNTHCTVLCLFFYCTFFQFQVVWSQFCIYSQHFLVADALKASWSSLVKCHGKRKPDGRCKKSTRHQMSTYGDEKMSHLKQKMSPLPALSLSACLTACVCLLFLV